MNTFTLTLNLGNEAMQTAEDISNALTRAAGWIEDYAAREVEHGGSMSLKDQNGNTVGMWTVA